MAKSRLRRLLGGLALAIAVVAAGLVPGAPAAADPSNSMFTWRWGYYGTRSTCTLTASMGRYSVGGKVNLRGTFNGCNPRGGGAGAGVLTVISSSPSRHGGSVGLGPCMSANYCTKTVGIPYIGPRDYCGRVWFSDDGYRRRYGRDPYIYACAYVSR